MSPSVRSLFATFEEEVTVRGLPGYRFVPPSRVFASPTVNPDNAGFCVPLGNCLSSGVLNVSVCKQGETRLPEPSGVLRSSTHYVYN